MSDTRSDRDTIAALLDVVGAFKAHGIMPYEVRTALMWLSLPVLCESESGEQR